MNENNIDDTPLAAEDLFNLEEMKDAIMHEALSEMQDSANRTKVIFAEVRKRLIAERPIRITTEMFQLGIANQVAEMITSYEFNARMKDRFRDEDDDD